MSERLNTGRLRCYKCEAVIVLERDGDSYRAVCRNRPKCLVSGPPFAPDRRAAFEHYKAFRRFTAHATA